MKDTEIEIQVKIQRKKKLLEFLKKQAKFNGKFRQIDHYYTPKHRNFTAKRPILEWFRTRQSGKKSSINYKKWKISSDGKTWHCDEYETVIEDIKQVEKILKVLNFVHLCRVDKTRSIYKYNNFEIALDIIKGLGSFVEVEYKSKNKIKVKEAVNEMIVFLKDKGCGKIQRNNGGYPFMLMFPKEVIFEEIG